MLAPINVLVADSSQMQLQLLTSALRRRPEFKVISCPLDPDLILKVMGDAAIDVLLLEGVRRRRFRDRGVRRLF